MKYLLVLLMLVGCSTITDPGAVVEVPNDNSIAVIGFSGSACTNCEQGYIVRWYDVIKVEDKGDNVVSVPDRINLLLTQQQDDRVNSLKPYRTVLIAERSGEYWRLIKIVRNQ